MRLLHDILKIDGYAVLQTANGMEALKLAREHRPDLILMDIHLPEVSGIEVIKWMKAEDTLTKIPIVAITASAMKGDEEKILRSGCDAYIAKPISLTDFRRMVQRFFAPLDLALRPTGPVDLIRE